jgi:DNA-binding PadR family transcriptional regulator
MMSQLTPDETLLGLIALRPRHGYDLLECFRDPDQLGEVWKLSTSQVYAVLKRLETQGLINGAVVAVPDAPARVEYQLTERGAARLAAWLAEPQPSPSIRSVRVMFLSRLFVARLLNMPTQPIVARQKEACQQTLDAIQRTLGQAAPGVGWLALDLIIAQYQVILKWLDRCDLSPRFMDER